MRTQRFPRHPCKCPFLVRQTPEQRTASPSTWIQAQTQTQTQRWRNCSEASHLGRALVAIARLLCAAPLNLLDVVYDQLSVPMSIWERFQSKVGKKKVGPDGVGDLQNYVMSYSAADAFDKSKRIPNGAQEVIQTLEDMLTREEESGTDVVGRQCFAVRWHRFLCSTFGLSEFARDSN